MRGARLGLGVVLVLAGGGLAHADRATARALAEEGARLNAAGKADLALARFDDAIAADPDYQPAYDGAAELHLAHGDFARVVELMSRATTRDPNYKRGWYALGFAYRRLGKLDLAVACYETYLSLQADDPDPYFGLGMAALELGDRAKAGRALQRYVELETRADHQEFVAQAERELGKLGIASGHDHPVRFLSLDAQQKRALLDRAVGLVAATRYASAQRLLDSDLGRAADPAERWRLKAAAYLGAGQADRALAAGLMALAYAPIGAELGQLLAEIERARGDRESATYFLTLE